jgi:hypothetical protein
MKDEYLLIPTISKSETILYYKYMLLSNIQTLKNKSYLLPHISFLSVHLSFVIVTSSLGAKDKSSISNQVVHIGDLEIEN